MPIEKFNDILSKLNESEKKVNLLQEKNKKLSLKLKEKEKFESEFSGLDNKGSKESSFFDENMKKVLQNPFDVKSNKSDKINILKDVPSIPNDDDAMELIQNQLKDMKLMFKEEKDKNEKLCELIKEVFKNIKVDSKTKDLCVQICNIFGFHLILLGN